MEITKETKLGLLNELYNTYKDSDPTKAMVIHSLIQDMAKQREPSARPLILM